jgi:hypothetical protein
LIAALLLATAAAAAPEPSITDDVRCLIVMSAISGSATEPQAKQGGMFGTLIWYGRLSARMPAEAIAATVKQEAAKMNKDNFVTDAKRCGAEMSAYGTAMQALGAEMKAEGAK